MATASVNQRRWSRFGLLFLAAILCYALLTFLGWILGAVVVKRFPENYDWQVRAAMRKGNLEKAEAIARSRVQKEHYDFKAHRLLATVLIEAGDFEESVGVLTMSLNRMETASGREVYTLGSDPAETYQLLAAALQGAGRDAYAKEAAAIAADYKAIAAVSDSASSGSAKVVTVLQVSDVPDVVETGTELSVDDFRLNGAVAVSTSDTLQFTGQGSAIASLQGIWENGAPTMALQFAGSKALGIGAILKVTVGDREILRAYASHPAPRWIVIPLENRDEYSSDQLTFEFINDAFDPVTKSDRNVEVLQVILK